MIEVRGLTKHYGKMPVVDDLTFTLRPGLVTGFLGPNGAGKTTTMRMILNLENPTRGAATVNGRRFVELNHPMRQLGSLIDAGAVHGRRTAHDHLLCLAQSNAIPRRRVGEVLALVGLGEVAGRRVGGFSLGMLQRLGIAAAMLGDPATLMLDEPINGLDPEGILWIRTLMRRLADEGRTVLVSSHLMSEMALTADHVIVIGKGRLIMDAPISDISGSGGHQGVLVRTPAPDELTRSLTDVGASVRPTNDGALLVSGLDSSEVGRLAHAHRILLQELTPQRVSLEEAFMHMTRDRVEFRAAESSTTEGAA